MKRILTNTSALAVSNLWRIGVSFALQLLIARRLGVEALGVYSIPLAYLNVAQVVSELGLPGLLVRDLAQQASWRRNYVRQALTVQAGVALLAWAGLALLALFGGFSAGTRTALWLIGASLPFYAVTSITQTLFQAGERLELVLVVELLINTLILVASLLLLWLGAGVIQLVGLLVITQLLSALTGWWLLMHSGILPEPQKGSLESRSALLRRAGPFYAQALGDVLLQRADLLLIGIVAGPVVVGIYSAAYNLVRVLLKLVQSFLQALYPTLSRLQGEEPMQFRRVATWSLRWGLLFALLAASAVSVLAQPLLQRVYGTNYLNATPVLQILVWLAPLVLIESYTSARLMVGQRPARSLLISGGHLLALVVLLPVLTLTFQAIGAAWAGLAAGLVGAGVSVRLLWQMRTPGLVDSSAGPTREIT